MILVKEINPKVSTRIDPSCSNSFQLKISLQGKG